MAIFLHCEKFIICFLRFSFSVPLSLLSPISLVFHQTLVEVEVHVGVYVGERKQFFFLLVCILVWGFVDL
jgi:hypothetical protein